MIRSDTGEIYWIADLKTLMAKIGIGFGKGMYFCNWEWLHIKRLFFLLLGLILLYVYFILYYIYYIYNITDFCVK